MDVTRLREQLARLTGPARIPVLLQLGQTLGMTYWSAGPGTPAALGHLSASIDALDEAYLLVDRDDPARGQLAGLLGWLLSARHGLHGGADEDRENGIAILREALEYPSLQPMHATIARIALGQMHLSRATEAMQPAGLRGGRLPTGCTADCDEAVRRFREVLDGPAISAEVTEVAQTLRTVAESMRPLLSGDLARFDVGKLMNTMAVMQRLQQKGFSFATPGSGMPFDLTGTSPLDYPVASMQGGPQQAPTVPPRRTAQPAPAPAAPAEPDSARRAVRDRLAALTGAGGEPVWEQALRLLEAGPSAIGAGDLDAFVGAAANAVGAADAVGADRGVEAGLDHLLSAVGFCLRDRRDGIGWDEDVPFEPAATHLAAATDAVPPSHPAACAVVEALGGLLDDERPLSGAVTAVAGRFADYADAISPRPDVVTALRDVCRAVPLTVDVPADHPWHGVLATADRHARLLAGDLSDLDPAAAVAGISDPSPREAAVMGAVQDDPHAAIRLLRTATRELDDSGLRTRSLWRLAAAYRKTGDVAASRAAGLLALRGSGQDRVNAAVFAGWMLAEGRGEEAYTALEVAAASPTVADPLTADLIGVITGRDPVSAPGYEPSAWPDVAAALRKVGASALLYLHAGQTAGVLCLDPATDRLDVLANVPVADPLESDDPGWSAIVGRWTSGHLLVAATGDLARIALPAVRTSGGRRLAQDVDVSYVRSGAQVVTLSERPAVPVGNEPLFVVNPRGDRDAEMPDVMVLRRLFYPRSACVGRALESVDAAGSREDVRSRLADASMVHLACGLDGTRLQLAGSDVLDAAGGGLLVLTGPGPASPFLDAGFLGVIGWHRPVPAPFAALALFMTHLMLTDRRLPPAAAVTAVQRWMIDPDRELPPFLTAAHQHTVDTTDLTRPALWAALAYYGC